jgi:O-antigen/teichoic acid export membrane protein
MTARKRFLRNGLAAVLQKGVRILDQLLLVPFFLSAWGPAYYGEWLTLMVIPTVMGFSDMGFGTAAANGLILRYASGDRQGAADFAASGFRAIHMVVTIGLLASLCLVMFGGYSGLLSGSLIPQPDALLAVALMAAARIIAFYQQLCEAYFNAARRADISINLQTGFAILSLVFSIIVLTNSGDLLIFACVHFAWTTTFTAAYALLARRTLQLHRSNSGIVRSEDLRVIWQKGLGYLLSPVWQAIFFQGTTLAVRTVLGPVAVTIFNTVRTVTRATNQIYSMVISATLSELQYEIGIGNFDRARRIFRVGLAMILTIAVAGMLTLSLGGEWLYGIWTHKSLNPPTSMWYIFIAGIGFNAVWWPASFIFQAMNRPYDFAIAGVICAIISVALSYALAHSNGLVGAAAGTVAMDVLLFLYLLPRGCRLLGQKMSRLPQDIWTDILHIRQSRTA